MERLTNYVLSRGKPGLTSGAKVANIGRAEWTIMQEPASAAAAVRTGEVDRLDAPPPDLLPLLRRDPALVVSINDTTGVLPILRFNSTLAPFDNPAIRRGSVRGAAVGVHAGLLR